MNAFTYESFPTLRTNRLVLNELGIQHESALRELITSHPGEKANRSVQEVLQATLEDFQNKNGITWGMIFENELIGTCGFYRGFKDAVGEVGYVLRKEYRSQGFMQESMHSVLEFGFSTLGLNAIVAVTDEANIPSVRLLESFKFSPTNEVDAGFRKFILTNELFQQ